jgi:hypothetical protein
MKDVLINNTGSDIRMFNKDLFEAGKSGVLPEDLEDVFNMEIIVIEGDRRIIINFKED